jgi:hypothetical protein
MTATRRFLIDLADGLDAAPRVQGMVVMSDGTAELLSARARQLAGSPLPPVLTMPERIDQLIAAEFRTPFKAA